MQDANRPKKNKKQKLSGDDFDDDDDIGSDDPASKKRQSEFVIKPVAGPTRMRKRHILAIVSFCLFVLAPVFTLGWYLYFVAVPQFASNTAFIVRSEEQAPAASILGFPVGGGTETDAEIVNAFITSQQMVLRVDQKLDLRSIYSRDDADWLFRFRPDGTIEDLITYWGRVVTVAFQADKGLMDVRVLAFSAEEAQKIAQEILDQSGQMINDLSAVAEEDATRYARSELERAEDALKAARRSLTEFRSSTQTVDPDALVSAQMGLLNSLQQQLADSVIELALLRDVTRANDPRIEQAERKIKVIEEQITIERAKLGKVAEGSIAGTMPVTEIVGRFEELKVDVEFAQEKVLAARAAMDAALEKARRKSRYLATYVEPTLAEASEYPQKEILLGVSSLFIFLIWAVFTIIMYSIRDRR